MSKIDLKKYIELSNVEYEKNGASDLFNKAQDKIIATKDPNSIYGFARHVEGIDVSKFEEAIIKTGNVECIIGFARYVKGADISKIEDIIIATGEPKYIYDFARGADYAFGEVLSYLEEPLNGINVNKLQYMTRKV